MPQVKVIFEYIDNSAAICVNGVQVWSISFEEVGGAFATRREADISGRLGAGSNMVQVDGINYGPWTTPNPARFKYQITVDGVVVAAVEQKNSTMRPSNTTSYVAASSAIEIYVV